MTCPSSSTMSAAGTKKRNDDNNRSEAGVTMKRLRRLLPLVDKTNLWLQVPDEVLAQILHMTSRDPNDLIGLEASCRSLQRATCRCWKILAKKQCSVDCDVDERATAGRDLWNEGRTLESLSAERSSYVYMRNTHSDVFRGGIFFGCNKSIFVMGSSEHDAPHFGSDGFVPQAPIRIRNAKTLQIMAHMEGTFGHKAVDVVGPSGNELILEYSDGEMKAHRNCQVVWEHKWKDSMQTDVWCLVSSEKSVIVVRNQKLHVFVVKQPNMLLEQSDTLILEGLIEAPTMNWIKEGSDFILQVGHGVLALWNISNDDHKLTKKSTLLLSVKKLFHYVYAGSKHLVASGAQNDDGMYVFNHQGALLHRLFENLPKPNKNYSWSPLNCSVVNGCVLVSNSLMGAALCIWNLRTGELVHRFEQSITLEHVKTPGQEHTHGKYVDCMDLLPSFDFPFFLLADDFGSMFSWGFPSNKDQIERMQSLGFRAAHENSRLG